MERLRRFLANLQDLKWLKKICEKMGFKVFDFEHVSNEDLCEDYAHYIENYYPF